MRRIHVCKRSAFSWLAWMMLMQVIVRNEEFPESPGRRWLENRLWMVRGLAVFHPSERKRGASFPPVDVAVVN
jgi:hypothetical protein